MNTSPTDLNDLVQRYGGTIGSSAPAVSSGIDDLVQRYGGTVDGPATKPVDPYTDPTKMPAPNSIWMVDSKGANGRWIGASSAPAAINNGWRTTGPTHLEDEQNKKTSWGDVGNSFVNMGKGVAKTALSMARTLGPVVQVGPGGVSVADPTAELQKLASEEKQNSIDAMNQAPPGASGAEVAAMGVGGALGISTTDLAASARRGDVKGMIAAGGPALGAALLPEAMRGMRGIRGEFGDSITSYEDATAPASASGDLYPGRPSIRPPLPEEMKTPIGLNPLAKEKPGDYIAASLKPDARFDMPALSEASHGPLSEAMADLGYTGENFVRAGKNGPKLFKTVVDHAIDLAEDRANQVFDPIKDYQISLKGNPELAAEFPNQQTASIEALRDKIVELNKRLENSNFYNKGEVKQGAVNLTLDEVRLAAKQARGLTYDAADKLLGDQYPGIGDMTKNMRATESALFDLKENAVRTHNALSGETATYNTVSPVKRGVNTVGAVMKTVMGGQHGMVPTAYDPTILRPTFDFNYNMRRAFSNVKEPVPADTDLGLQSPEVPPVTGLTQKALPTPRPMLSAPEGYVGTDAPEGQPIQQGGSSLPPTAQLPAGRTPLQLPAARSIQLPASSLASEPQTAPNQPSGAVNTTSSEAVQPSAATGPARAMPLKVPESMAFSIVKGKIVPGSVEGAEQVNLAKDGTMSGDPGTVKRYQTRISKDPNAKGFLAQFQNADVTVGESKPSMTPGDSGTTSLSNEEVQRAQNGERYCSISKSGDITAHGAQPDGASNLKGGAIVKVKPDGTYDLQSGDRTIADRYKQRVLKAVFGTKGAK